MKNFLLALATLPLVIGPAVANPRCRTCVAPVKVVKRVKVVRKVFAVTKIFPTYASVYLPPAPVIVQPAQTVIGQQAYNVTATQGVGVAVQHSQAVQAGSELQQVLAELKGLCKRIDALEQGQSADQPFAVKKGVPKALARCAACHSTTNADKDGAGFVMWDKGKLATFSERDLRKIGAHVANGTMPPANNAKGVKPLTDEDAAEISRWIASFE